MAEEELTLNLYLVVSEEIREIIWEDWFNYVGHEEWYCIAELVVARNRGQAKWLAWKRDSSFSRDIRDMPKFHTCLKQRKVIGPTRIASKEYKDDALWYLRGGLEAQEELGNGCS